MPGFEMEDPEEEARALQMRRNIEDKAREEDEKKSERRLRAAQTLKQMQSERLAVVEKRREINNANEIEARKNRKDKEEYKTPWDKILANIDVKEADYKGGRDVSRFRQALLNKKSDASNFE